MSGPGSTVAQVKWSSLEKVLPYRQTSVKSDEGLCLSTLLGIDLKALYNLENAERLRRMFLHIGTISPSILFGDRPRLEQEGYRWTPTSLVGQQIEPSKDAARVTESGVKVKLPSLMVDFPSRGFMLGVRPGNVEGSFGFLPLDPEDGPGHLVAASFPIRLCGTNLVFMVDLTLSKENPGFITPTSKARIILEKSVNDTTLASIGSVVERVLLDWKRGESKPLIEGFVVDMGSVDDTFVQYRVPATIHILIDPTTDIIAAAAQASQTEDIEWLIS